MTDAAIAFVCLGAFAACLAATYAAQQLGRRGFLLPAATGRLGCVDGLRGYLATFVMVYHFILFIEVTRLGGVWSRPKLGFFDSFGPGSVNLFFMTTGFLFYPRILNGLRSVDWRTLYISRVFRIVPLLIFLLVAVSTLILARLDFHPNDSVKNTALGMLRWIVCWDQPDLWGYRNSGQLGAVLWSLWFEWLFYIFVLPACALAMSLRGRAPSWIVPTALIGVSIGLRRFHLTALIDFLPLFGIGMIGFEIRNRPTISAMLTTRFATLIAFSCLIAGAVLPSGPARMLLHGIFFICVASGCSLWGLLKTQGSRILGEVSYGIYVLHMLMLNILFVSFAGVIGRMQTIALPALMPVAAVATLFAATFAFLSVERPGIRLGKALAKEAASRVGSWRHARHGGAVAADPAIVGKAI